MCQSREANPAPVAQRGSRPRGQGAHTQESVLLQNPDLRRSRRFLQVPFCQQSQEFPRLPAQRHNLDSPKTGRATLEAQQGFAHQRGHAFHVPSLPVMTRRAHLNQRLQKALFRFFCLHPHRFPMFMRLKELPSLVASQSLRQCSASPVEFHASALKSLCRRPLHPPRRLSQSLIRALGKANRAVPARPRSCIIPALPAKADRFSPSCDQSHRIAANFPVS